MDKGGRSPADIVILGEALLSFNRPGSRLPRVAVVLSADGVCVGPSKQEELDARVIEECRARVVVRQGTYAQGNDGFARMVSLEALDPEVSLALMPDWLLPAALEKSRGKNITWGVWKESANDESSPLEHDELVRIVERPQTFEDLLQLVFSQWRNMLADGRH